MKILLPGGSPPLPRRRGGSGDGRGMLRLRVLGAQGKVPPACPDTAKRAVRGTASVGAVRSGAGKLMASGVERKRVIK